MTDPVRGRRSLDRCEAAKLGDVAWREIGQAGDLEQPHGADDLAAEDFDGAVDAGAAAAIRP